METPINYSNKYLAEETIVCSGDFGCIKPCKVRLKIRHRAISKIVDFFTFANQQNHGPDYKSVEGKLKLHKFIRKIVVSDKQCGGGKKYGTTPAIEFLKISKNNLEKNLPANPRSILPTIKQIENLLYYERRKEFGSLSEEEKLTKFVQEYQNHVIYPPNLTEFTDMVIIIKFGSVTLEKFVSLTQKPDSVVGMDSQFCNNSHRLPVTILLTQDENLETVPGFIGIFDTASEKNYTTFLSKIKLYLLQEFKYDLKCYMMIDKCCSERNASLNNGLKVLLCEFHLIRIWEEKIRKHFKKCNRCS